MKLNYRKTIFVGFAFFLICAFWQAYDAIMPIIAVNKFGLNQTTSGIIMAIDNILALFMLPLFGALSDKKQTKYGKRTPFIVIGTVCAVICFCALTFSDYAQLKNNLNYGDVQVGTTAENELLWDANSDVSIGDADEDDGFFTRLFASSSSMPLQDWIADDQRIADDKAKYDQALAQYIDGASLVNPVQFSGMVSHKSYSEWRDYYLTLNEFASTKNADLLTSDYGFIAVSSQEDFEGIAFRIPKASILTSEPYASMSAAELDALEGSEDDPIGKSLLLNPYYTEYVSTARSGYAWSATLGHPVYLVLFVILLLGTVVGMAIFRSPAVALMPDVTIKPLRSKANAIINLMGAAGGMLVLGLGMIFKTTDAQNALMSYVGYAFAVSALMLAALALFLWKVRENKFVEDMKAQSRELGIADEPETETKTVDTAKSGLTRSQKISLGLILASVALWFLGYNAVTSKYSLYATNILDKDYNLTLLLAQAAAIVSYIPVGFIATKFGRKRTVLVGVILLAAAFLGGSFVTAATPDILVYLMFACAGIAWATINVNSFPMAVEFSNEGNVGKYTGYYYTASMAAQITTPILSGILMDQMGMKILFPYAALFTGLAIVTMCFVKHGDSRIKSSPSATAES